MMENFKINNKLNIQKLRSDFKKNKTVIIENFLDKRSADKLYNFLAFEMPEDWWYTSYYIQSLSGDCTRFCSRSWRHEHAWPCMHLDGT